MSLLSRQAHKPFFYTVNIIIFQNHLLKWQAAQRCISFLKGVMWMGFFPHIPIFFLVHLKCNCFYLPYFCVVESEVCFMFCFVCFSQQDKSSSSTVLCQWTNIIPPFFSSSLPGQVSNSAYILKITTVTSFEQLAKNIDNWNKTAKNVSSVPSAALLQSRSCCFSSVPLREAWMGSGCISGRTILRVSSACWPLGWGRKWIVQCMEIWVMLTSQGSSQ